MTVELIEQCAKVGENDTVDMSLMSSIEIIFKSLSCINGSFLVSNDGHTCCSAKNHGINIVNAENAFYLIQTMENQTLKSVVSVFCSSDRKYLFLTVIDGSCNQICPPHLLLLDVPQFPI